MRRSLIVIFIVAVAIAVFQLTQEQSVVSNPYLSEYYILNANEKIQSPNVVTSIYLYFRYYDTLFETMILLFGIMGIITLSVHDEDDDDE